MHLIGTVVLLPVRPFYHGTHRNAIGLSNVLLIYSSRGGKKWKWFYRLSAERRSFPRLSPGAFRRCLVKNRVPPSQGFYPPRFLRLNSSMSFGGVDVVY